MLSKKNWFVIIIGSGLTFNGYYFINSIDDLIPEVVAMPSVAKKDARLKKENIQLKKEVKRLQNQQKEREKKITERRKNKEKRTLKRIETKIAKTPAGALPLIGTGIVVATAGYEINELCQDIEDERKFEAKLFNKKENLNNSYQPCGMQQEEITEIIISSIKQQVDDGKAWFDSLY